MNAGNIVPLIFAIPLVVCLFIRESRWRRRSREWLPSTGEMLRMNREPGDDGSCPVIEYEFNGSSREQICEFNLTAPAIGEKVPILIEQKSGEIFVVRALDRWVLSAILVICIVFLIVLSSLSS